MYNNIVVFYMSFWQCFCVEPLRGPYACEVSARYQHIEELYVQLQVPVTLSTRVSYHALSCVWGRLNPIDFLPLSLFLSYCHRQG
jgi:hypothetical protein